MTVTVSAPSMPFPFPSTRGTGFPASFSPPVAGPVSGKRSGGAPLLCSAADVKSSLPSIVSSGLLPSSSLSSPAFYATSGPATSSSSGSSSIAHIPLSLARRQLSSASSEWVSHRLRQQQLVEQLTGAFVSWQRQAVDEYSQIVARCKTEANHAIAALGQHQPASAAKADWRREAKSAGSATRDEHDSRPLPPPIAAEHISTAAVDVQSGAAWSQLQTVQAPVDGESAAIMAEWESANARQQEAAQTVQQMAEDMGLHTSPLDCQPSLHAFHSLLASWLAERSTLAARVQTIKQTQSALQAEKARLTAWKDTIKQQQQQQQGTDSEAGSSAVQLAEEGKQWEAAKQKLASDGARLKEEHAEYERRIAEYKSAEASIKQKWADIAQSATSEPTPPLPTADRLSALLGELQKVQQANKQLADANGQLTAHTATRQHQQERQAQQELQTIANVAGAATPPAAGGESKQNAGAGHIPSQSADMATSLSAAERRIVEQQRQLAELTRQLVVAQPAEKDHKASRATHTANGSHSTTNRGSAATAAESVETIPLPVSTAAPSPSSSCSSCDSLLARCASLQISLSQCAAELSTANSLLSSERERHAAVESEWRQQQSVYSSSIAGASGTAEVEIARHVREASQRQLQLEDLSRLLDETVRKGNRELNETRASQQRMMEEAVSTLERQQANERQQWAQQLEASVAAADEQSAAREAVEERLAEEERRWRETDAQLTEQRAAFEALRAEAAEALQTRDALFAQVASATADIERLHGVIELEKQKAAEADRDRLQMFDRLREEQKRRKEFQFKYEDAKGKVRVYARVRPFTAAEVAARERTLLRPGRNEWTLELNETQRDVLGNISDKWREFAFDHVFHAGLPPDTKGNGSQAEVFEETAAFAELSLQGINCCIFAYGQSGTGQTEQHTIDPHRTTTTTVVSDSPHPVLCCAALPASLLLIRQDVDYGRPASHCRERSQPRAVGAEAAYDRASVQPGSGYGRDARRVAQLLPGGDIPQRAGGLVLEAGHGHCHERQGREVARGAGAESEGGRRQEEGADRQRAGSGVQQRGRHARLLRQR